jgi:hypothetical protein
MGTMEPAIWNENAISRYGKLSGPSASYPDGRMEMQTREVITKCVGRVGCAFPEL